MAKKIHYSGRQCKECGHALYWVYDVELVDGIEYDHRHLYCESCGYEEEYRPKKRHKSLDMEG
jgi:ribosomal protein L37E